MSRSSPKYRLLERFQNVFEGTRYKHRDSSIGDSIAIKFYEDLHSLHKSSKLVSRIENHERVINVQNVRQGVKARRGDGTFGELIPGEDALALPGFKVARGRIATVEIGVEVKILAKAMIKQIDRVMTDLGNQVQHFKRKGGTPICIAVVGINWSPSYTSYEGDRAWPTDGKKYAHPIQEAAQAESRLREEIAGKFDEFLVLRFRATNAGAFPFEWIDYRETFRDYGAILTRISREYEKRF